MITSILRPHMRRVAQDVLRHLAYRGDIGGLQAHGLIVPRLVGNGRGTVSSTKALMYSLPFNTASNALRSWGLPRTAGSVVDSMEEIVAHM